MTGDLIASCSVALSDGMAGEAHLMPFGRNVGRDGRGPYVLRDMDHARQVIATTAAYQRGADLPIDYEHQNQRAPASVPARPAAGWIKAEGLTVGPTGIWGRVEWTATAAAHIGKREYRYLSPVFTHTPDGTVLRIVGAGLTAFPNLELTALASQGATMDTLTSAKALLGLDAADDTTFLKTVGDLVKLSKVFVAQLGLPPDTGPAGLLDALTQRANERGATTAAQAPDLSATVAVIQALASQAETYRQQVTQAKVDDLVSAAMSAGKVTPAMRPWLTALAHQDFDTFKGLVNSLPPAFAHLFTSDFKDRPPMPPGSGTAPSGLSPGQLAVCSQLGLSSDEYSQTLKD